MGNKFHFSANFLLMRKFILLTLTLLLIVFTAQAQIKKGAVLLGGNISVGKSKQTYTNTDNESTNSYLNISPSLGFVTADNAVWGFNLTVGIQTSESNQPTEAKASSYGGAFFHRRYVTLGKGFYLFGQAAAGYNYNKQKISAPTNNQTRTTRTDHVYVSAYPGVTYAVSKNFHLEAGLNELLSLSYSVQNETTVSSGSVSTYKNKGFSFGTNFSNSNPFNVGFRFLL